MKKSVLIYIVFCFFISGCNPYLNFADKYYNPKDSSDLHLDYSIDLNVNVIPTLYRNEIRKAIERDFCPVFNDCKNLGGDLNLDIKVNNFTYKTPIYGLAWLPLVYVGVPYHPNIATICFLPL
ncbi:MAG TPA: hypothetical protein VJ951_14455 [Bacteroidales bacterium]|nr:hypothetical protein [Bacteroidales bacterium]